MAVSLGYKPTMTNIKTILPIPFLIAIFSSACVQVSNSPKKAGLTNEKNISFDKDRNANAPVTGSWAICSYGNDSMVWQMNICEEILFQQNGIAIMQSNGIVKKSYTWKTQADTLYLSALANNQPSDLLADNLYRIVKTTHQASAGLCLVQPAKHLYINLTAKL